MADVNFSIYDIQSFGHSMNDVAYQMTNRRETVDNAIGTLRTFVSEMSSKISNALASMAHDRSVAYTVRSHNNKKLEEINSELGNLRNTNTEGCNDAAIKSKEREHDEVRALNRQLDNIISQIDNVGRQMESKLFEMRSHLSRAESARNRFNNCFSESGPQGKIRELEKKTRIAVDLGKRAFYHLSLNDKGYSSSETLTINNINCLINTSNALHERQRKLSSVGQEMMKKSYAYSDMMQSEIMRNSYAITKEMFSEEETYSKFLGHVGGCLKDAYSCLYDYKNLIR